MRIIITASVLDDRNIGPDGAIAEAAYDKLIDVLMDLGYDLEDLMENA